MTVVSAMAAANSRAVNASRVLPVKIANVQCVKAVRRVIAVLIGMHVQLVMAVRPVMVAQLVIAVRPAMVARLVMAAQPVMVARLVMAAQPVMAVRLAAAMRSQPTCLGRMNQIRSNVNA